MCLGLSVTDSNNPAPCDYKQMSDPTLDVRDRPPADRHATVFDAFESLAPGESVTVVNDHDPSPLIHQIEYEFETFDAEASTVEHSGEDRFEARLVKGTAEQTNDEVDVSAVVADALQGVTDPELGVSVIDAGVIASVERTMSSESGKAGVIIELDTTGLPRSGLEELEASVESAVANEPMIDRVTVRRQAGDQGATVSVDEVRTRLADVSHPDLTEDVLTSEVVTDIDLAERTVTISVEESALPGDLGDFRGEFLELVGQAAYNAHGVAEVQIDTGDAVVPIEPPQTEDPPLADAPEAGGPPGTEEPSPLQHGVDQQSSAPPTLDLSGIENVVVVASTKGGVGKTTVATQLARSLSSQGQDIGLLDADFTGPDIPTLLGLEPQITEGSIIEPVEYEGIQVMSVGLMQNRPTAWNGEMIHNALFNLLEDVGWDAETLVVDLPPGASDTLMTFLQFVPIDGVLLVTTPYPASIADTNEGATLFKEGDIPVLGVVLNMATFACPNCDEEHDLFPTEDAAEALDYPVVTDLPFSREIRSFSNQPPDRFQTLAETIVEGVSASEEVTVPEDAIDVRGLPDHGRVETVEDAFIGLAPEEVLTVVSDRHPAGLAVALVDVVGVNGSPSEVFDEYAVAARDADEWVLRVRKPQEADSTSA